MKARIFDIQRGSFVDGPGIRTTIFFQGCNLRCIWCHNPESWEARTQLMYFENRCTHCGFCASFCEVGAVSPTGAIDRNRCVACGKCALACPNDARSLCGREAPIDELIALCLKDREYYVSSGGGVTISGGECMLQPHALVALLTVLKQENVNTAVDTAGNVPWSTFEQILPLTDYFLYDVKCLSSELHCSLTGVGNERILENYERLIAICPGKVIVRVPVIPGANDVQTEMEYVAQYLRAHAPSKVEFLPYHRLGEGKSAAIGRKVFTADVPDKTRIACLQALVGS